MTHTISVEITEKRAGEELSEIDATYPRDVFIVNAAQHEDVPISVDTDGDGQVEKEFNETTISGVNNNAYSYTVTLETGYTLQAGDVVTIAYPTIDHPADPGTYTVETQVNGQAAANKTVTIE